MKKLPIGVDDFARIASGNYLYIDKTAFISEVLRDGAAVLLLLRPRRFGKTLNMSTLQHFLEFSQTSCRE